MVNCYLVQVSERGSIDLIQHNRYVNYVWEKNRKDLVHGSVSKGDQLFVYLTRKSIIYPNELRLVYEVTSVGCGSYNYEVKLIGELIGFSYKQMQQMMKNNTLTRFYSYCGRQGFNITRINSSDIDPLLKKFRKIDVNYETKMQSHLKSYKKIDEDKMELLSNINLLKYYSEEGFQGMSSTHRKHLTKSGFISKKVLEKKRTIFITKKGYEVLADIT
jgi:hypothetical protein